jgi:hypothetical protein
LVAALALFSAAAFGILPLGYSRFSWEALGQPYGDGLPCTDPGECISGFCVDGVCCDTACDGTGEACNLPNRAGICTAVTGAPVLSIAGQIVAVLALILGGWFGWQSRRQER